MVRRIAGWGGRIRTFTIHINSVVSYRLDHAPAVFSDLSQNHGQRVVAFRGMFAAEGFPKITRPDEDSPMDSVL